MGLVMVEVWTFLQGSGRTSFPGVMTRRMGRTCSGLLAEINKKVRARSSQACSAIIVRSLFYLFIVAWVRSCQPGLVNMRASPRMSVQK
jgi:hypothetical protein